MEKETSTLPESSQPHMKLNYLRPGDMIACGTSLGARSMKSEDEVVKEKKLFKNCPKKKKFELHLKTLKTLRCG